LGYDLTEKIVFITGASRGIGRACAVAFVRAGAKVVATARTLSELESLSAQLGASNVIPIQLDVTDAAQREGAVARARQEFGPIDVLVNNAGWATIATVEKTPSEHVARMLALNFAAPPAMTQLVLPEMVGRASGQIINISSVVGIQAIPRMTIYSATKAALTSFSTGLRMELRGSGVDVINIAPSSTRTEFFEAAATVDAKATRIAKTQYSPQRVARAVVAASRRRRREVTLSLEGNAISLMRRFSHRMADLTMFWVARFGMPKK
jgi:short-subunit dehydrogenase